MAFTLKSTVVNRHENLNYAIWDGIEKPVLAGTGITDWTEDASPNTDDGQYINENEPAFQYDRICTVSIVFGRTDSG